MPASSQAAQRAIEICHQAAEANLVTPARQGNLIRIPAGEGAEVMVSADLHGDRVNYRRIVEIADLEHNRKRHLVMQEVCHGGPSYPTANACMSHLLLEDMTRLKVQYPDRFHFLLGNHEASELMGFPISKAGQMLNLLFQTGVQELYGDAADPVIDAYHTFLRSCPLALLTPAGILVCHSLPELVDIEGFDASVFDRELTLDDLAPHGSAFRMLWGRDYRLSNVEAFCQIVGAKSVLHGHEPCPRGIETPNPMETILDSCGRLGRYVLLPADKLMSQEEIVQAAKRIHAEDPGEV